MNRIQADFASRKSLAIFKPKTLKRFFTFLKRVRSLLLMLEVAYVSERWLSGNPHLIGFLITDYSLFACCSEKEYALKISKTVGFRFLLVHISF